MKQFLKSCALVTLSSLFAVAVAEGLLHLFPGFLPVEVRQVFKDNGMAHPEIGNMPGPGSSGVIVTRDFAVPYRLDKQGFRNDEPWPERPDIVVIGDSLVFGYGVDRNEAWPQILSKLSGKTVVNLGLIGAGPQQYQRIYGIFGRPLKPAILVIGFFARNEFWDTDLFAQWQESGVGGNYLTWRDFGKPTAADLENPSNRLTIALRKNSYVLSLVIFARNTLRTRTRTELAPVALKMPDGTTLSLYKGDFDDKTRFSVPDNEVFETVINALKEIHDAASADGTRLLIVFQPGKEEVYRERTDQPYLDASAAIRARLDQIGIEYLDAAPSFRRKAESGRTLYFPTDGHPNVQGYELLAELVAEYLDKGTESKPDKSND